MSNLVSHVLTTFNCERCGRPGTRAHRYDGVGDFGVACVKRVAALHAEIGYKFYDRVAFMTVDGKWEYHGSVVESSQVAALAMKKQIEKVVCLSTEVFSDLRKEAVTDEPEGWAPLFEVFEVQGEVVCGR